MTIARNAEAVTSNWPSGTVGTGYIKMGNIGSAVTQNSISVGYDGTDPEFVREPI